MAAPKLVSAVVAPGRTVYAETEAYKAWDADSKREIDVVKARNPKGPGESVSLPEPEVARLRALGFLLAEGAVAVVKDGPAIATDEGPRVTTDKAK